MGEWLQYGPVVELVSLISQPTLGYKAIGILEMPLRCIYSSVRDIHRGLDLLSARAIEQGEPTHSSGDERSTNSGARTWHYSRGTSWDRGV